MVCAWDGEGEESFSDENVESGEDVEDKEFAFVLFKIFDTNSFGVERPFDSWKAEDESGLGHIGKGDNGIW